MVQRSSARFVTVHNLEMTKCYRSLLYQTMIYTNLQSSFHNVIYFCWTQLFAEAFFSSLLMSFINIFSNGHVSTLQTDAASQVVLIHPFIDFRWEKRHCNSITEKCIAKRRTFIERHKQVQKQAPQIKGLKTQPFIANKKKQF